MSNLNETEENDREMKKSSIFYGTRLGMAFLACAIFFAIILIFPIPTSFEDSFITYRYIAALSQYGGFFWNIEESPIYGMTGLIFPAVAGALNLFVEDPITSASITGLASSVICILILSSILPRNQWSIVLILSFAANVIFIRASTNGLETSLVFLYVLAVYILAEWRLRVVPASGLVALGFYIRPDIALISFLLFFFRFQQARNNIGMISFSCVTAVIIGALVFIASAYFGSPLPLPASIKIDGIGLMQFPNWVISQYVIYPALSSMPALIACISVFIVTRALLRRQTYFLLLPLFAFTIYQMTTLPIMNVGYRFFAPQIAGIIAVAAIQLRATPPELGKKARILLLATLPVSIPTILYHVRDSHRAASDHDIFASLGSTISHISGIYVASSEAGKLAYHIFPERFFDTVGLNNPFVAGNFSRPDYAELLNTYFSESRFPDIYVRSEGGIGAGDYAYLENMKNFSHLYECQDLRGLRICSLKNSELHDEIRHYLEEWAEG